MTARHEIRVGGRRLGRDRGAPIDATPAPPVGELLRVERERKGVDIYRAERDTKIRAKHLEALENGDYGELPGAVYTKGFLRNYSAYLGLDPEEIIERWRDETSMTRRTEAVAVAPPRPIAEPRGGFTVSRGLFAAALLLFVFVGFVAYIGSQVARFNQVTPVTVTGPLVRELPADAESHVLAGTTMAAATVVVRGPAEYHATTDANAAGEWSLEVPVTKGSNDFTVIANDPTTGVPSPPVNLVLIVPVPSTAAPSATVPATPTPAIPPAALTVTSPAEGAVLSADTVTVSGTTDGTRLVVTAAYVGPAGVTPGASPSAAASPSGEPVSPAPTPVAPAAVELPIEAGAFSGELALPLGRWTITVTASAEGRSDAVVTRTVDLAFDGLVVFVEIKGSDAWIVAWQDGRRARGTTRVFKAGETISLSADETIVVSTGNSGATHFTVDGVSLGALGRSGAVEAWLFEKGKDPRPAP